MDDQHQLNWSLEQKILLIVTRNAMVIFLICTLLYIFSDNISNGYKESFLILFFFGVIYWLVRFRYSITTKRIAAIWLMISVTISFFSHNGFSGATSLDICSLLIVIPLISKGAERMMFILIFVLQIAFFAFIQMFYPDLPNYSNYHSGIIYVIEVLARGINIMYIGYVYKFEYEKEQARMVGINKQLEQTNLHFAQYNVELKEILIQRTQTIQQLNDKFVEYASYNSHKIRGPLARILGLIYLIKLHSSRKEQLQLIEDEEYMDKLHKSADELDKAIKDISIILENGRKGVKPDSIEQQVA